VAAAIVSVPLSGLFLIEVASPRLLGLPDHRCPYDLVHAAPESLVAVALALAGTACVLWAGLVATLGRHVDTQELLPLWVAELLRLAGLAYLWSLLMLSVELVLS